MHWKHVWHMDKCVDEWSRNLWMNVTLISHLFIKLCVKCVFNVWYQWVKFTNYEWTNFAQFLLLNCEMLNLRPQELLKMNQFFICHSSMYVTSEYIGCMKILKLKLIWNLLVGYWWMSITYARNHLS